VSLIEKRFAASLPAALIEKGLLLRCLLRCVAIIETTKKKR
jgi:hypothetical protein